MAHRRLYIGYVLHLQNTLKFFSGLFADLQSNEKYPDVWCSVLFAGEQRIYRYIFVERMIRNILHTARDRIK
jgi:hypothetical protein